MELELQEQLSAQESEHMREAKRNMEAEIARLRTEGQDWIKRQEELLRNGSYEVILLAELRDYGSSNGIMGVLLSMVEGG